MVFVIKILFTSIERNVNVFGAKMASNFRYYTEDSVKKSPYNDLLISNFLFELFFEQWVICVFSIYNWFVVLIG